MHLRAGTRARDDVAQAERRTARPSVEGLTKPYCYHIDQFSRAPADHPQGDRVRPEDGPRHDPGRPRGRPGPARAELQLRPRRAHGRQPHDLPPDLPAGRAARCGAFPCFMPKPFMGVSANGCHHNISLWKGDENLFMPETRRSAAAEQDRPLRDRRRARAPRRADGRHAPRRSTRTAACGTRASGRRSSPTGASRTARPRCACRRRAASSTARSTRPSTRTCRSAALIAAMQRRHRPQGRSGRAGGAQHLRRRWRRARTSRRSR